MTTQPEFKLPLDTIKRTWIEDAAKAFDGLPLPVIFTGDDIHGKIPEPAQVNWYGCLMNKLKSEGRIQKLGYTTSKRKEANGRVVSQWMRVKI